MRLVGFMFSFCLLRFAAAIAAAFAAAMVSFVSPFGFLLLRVAFDPNFALRFALPSLPTSLISAVASVLLRLELCRVVGLSPRSSLFLLELILRQLFSWLQNWGRCVPPWRVLLPH